MHWFMFNKDQPGLLDFRYPWLPMWMNYNPEIPQKLLEAGLEALPKGLKPEEMTEEIWDKLDEAAALALERALPYVQGVREFMDAFRGVSVDERKAPRAVVRRPLSEDGVVPPVSGL